MHLPGQSGLELQADLQDRDQAPPIVFVTAYDDEPARNQAMARGALDFLRKPLDVDRLLDLIQQELES